MSVFPPWLRLIPWLLALCLSLALWAVWERGSKDTLRAEAAESGLRDANRTINGLKAQRVRNDEINARREKNRNRTERNLRGALDEIAKLKAAAQPRDCLVAPIGTDYDRVLRAAAPSAGASLPR